MSHCVKHEQCPKCAERGNDRSGNNLAVYSDGSIYCFSCGYYKSATGLENLRKSSPVVGKQLALPNDANTNLPEKAQRYLDKFGITKLDAQIHLIMWSEHWQRLIFAYFDDTGLLGWQGRYLGDEIGKPKWYSQGDLKSIIHLLGNKHSCKFVLTEDIISAIKVSHNLQVCAVPLFGSHIDIKKVLTLKKMCDTIMVYSWLDLDKQKESAKYCKKLRDLGFDAKTIITDLDPKCYTDDQIREILDYG